jgi:hypothetical protein
MFVKSYSFPIALFVMGVVSVLVSNLEITSRNSDLELVLGGAMLCLGFLLWAVPEMDRYLKRRDRMRNRTGRSRPADGPRPRTLENQRPRTSLRR